MSATHASRRIARGVGNGVFAPIVAANHLARFFWYVYHLEQKAANYIRQLLIYCHVAASPRVFGYKPISLLTRTLKG